MTVPTILLADHPAANSGKTLDEVHSLKCRLEADGSIVDSPQGQKVHAALPELRQARMALARLLASLKIPAIQ
jgi:hypothetical protein